MTFFQRFARLFAVCAFPVHIWALMVYFYDLPGLMMRMSPSDYLAHGSYVLAFALLESALLTALCAALTGRLTPAGLPAAQGRLFISGTWLVFLHLLPKAGERLAAGLPARLVLPAFSALLVALPVSYAAALLGHHRWLRRTPHAHQRTRALVERLEVLMGLYLLLDCAALFNVLARNL